MNPEEHEHEAEQWLDEALGRYRTAPPPPGLETRILAGLQARARQRQRRWLFTLAAGAAVLLAAVLITSRLNSRPEVNARDNVQTPAPKSNVIKTAESAAALPQKSATPNEHRRRERAAGNEQGVAAPRSASVKTDRRNRPLPLPEQQRLLRLYLSETPRQELALIATRQQLDAELPRLNIPPIEIKELTPKENK